VAQAIAELFECHDKARFDIIGLSFGPKESSDIRDRIAAALSGFHDVERKSDHEIAEMLRDHQVDVAVDLCGYTTHSRPGIFALRPAPIQVSYLGYAATMGSDCIDYIVADAVALPFKRQDHYAERIVHLPGCYLANSRQAPGTSPPTRSEAGLPEHAFVYCCFNNSWKITPAIFDTWMQILGECEKGVLWLSSTNDTAVRNLRGAAEARGIDPSRLVFAPRLDRLEDHLARHSLADLFLGTLPYNGHTTASQALWAGLPVLACKGGSFVGRVASSLLTSVGLDEMITSDLGQYKALALKLAGDPVMLANIRSKLVRNRDTHPLFDTQGLARHIESAYTTMWEARARGEKPKSFAVRA
jgi:predicted O-linked N-acetylglucosamine transferase (SPINDLY family)